MKKIDEILKVKSSNSPTDNSSYKYTPTVNSYTDGIYVDGNNFENDAIAQELAEKLEDIKSLSYYRILSKETTHQILRDVLAYVLETDRMGKIKTTKAIYFIVLLKIRGIKTKFKKEENEKSTK